VAGHGIGECRLYLFSLGGRATVRAVSRRPFSAEARVRSQVNPCAACGEPTGTEAEFSPSTSVLPFQYYSASALYSSSRAPGMANLWPWSHEQFSLLQVNKCNVI
jgi:hypothetical protein